MKYLGILLISVFSFMDATAMGQTVERVMSLDELYALADTQSKTIKIFETAVEGAGQEISVARNAYLPNVDVSVSASYNGNAWVADRNFSNGQNFTSPHFGNGFSVEASQVVLPEDLFITILRHSKFRNRFRSGIWLSIAKISIFCLRVTTSTFTNIVTCW